VVVHPIYPNDKELRKLKIKKLNDK